MINPLNFITKFIKSSNQRELEKIQKTVLKINELENKVSNFEKATFRKIQNCLKERIINGESLDNILPLGFAMVREASKRCNQERHFDVQLIGGHVFYVMEKLQR